MTVKDRIKAYCKAEKISITAFEKSIGVSNGYVNNISKSIGIDYLNTLIEKYSNLNVEWLLTGRGGMYKPNVSSVATPAPDTADGRHTSGDKVTNNIPNSQEKAIPFLMADQQNLKPIPLVTQTVAAGFGNENFAIADSDVKEFYVIPKFRYCNIDFMIEVSGDSMTPHLNSGDVIACSIIKDSHFIQWNRIHVIATREQGLLVKRLSPSDSEKYLQAISDNPKYPPFNIPKDEITGLALVVGSVCLE